jgi:peptidoglycan/LPS O-acetylase OafA/YrhL
LSANPSQPPKTLPSLTSIRAFAAVAVVVHHTRNAWPHLEAVRNFGEIGWLGVPLFFILSGFVLMYNFDPAIRWGDFVARRLFRIYPLHLATLAASLLLSWVAGAAIGGYLGNPAGTVLNVLLLHDLSVGRPDIRQAWNGVSWSLSCEFCFYLAAPMLFRRLEARPALVGSLAFAMFLLALATAIVANGSGADTVSDFLKFHPLPHFAEFALGALGALLVRRGWTFGRPALALALMAVPAAPYFMGEAPGEAVTNYLFVPGAFLLVASLGARDFRGDVNWLRNNALIRAGEASFALYMTHALLLPSYSGALGLFAPVALEGPLAGEIATLVFIVFAMTFAAAVHTRFEYPMNRKLLAWMRRRRAQGAAIAPTGA